MDPVQLPAWYLSTDGPKISTTIINIIGNVLPVLNMVLATKGINFIPDPSWNTWITLAVFAFFSIRAGWGYVRAKQALGAKINALEGQVTKMGALPVTLQK